MTHIDPAEIIPAGAAVPATVDVWTANPKVDLGKATTILDLLRDAGLKFQFDFNFADAEELWAARLSRFTIDVLVEAVQDWIASPDRNAPTVGEVELNAQHVLAQRVRDEHLAHNPSQCSECGGDRWVRDPGADGLRPCSLCPAMHRRYKLWVGGHFREGHVWRGCECEEYHVSWAEWQKRSKRRAS